MRNSVILLLLIAVISCQPKKESFLSKVQLTDLKGETLDSEQFSNKVVILNLWATWCNPCIKEMPDLVEMEKELPEDFVLILASDESLEKIQQFIERRSFDLSFTQIQTSVESLGVYSLPTTFIIGKEGQLLETLVGARKWDSPEQIEQLKTYLK
ncbi:MAG: thiol:disulfide interchange protein [Flammeovirgaceae bacterium]|nr:thiol:disulfide interchange protein [Flammeovirgaceae bacterium]MBR07724.1 thiol:disulfide interchange protein [Rickettsiales bacterium]HCX20620.1 thiol:disulfide interchange protein [Cytophagales bacterium]|tara:strand:- start:1500 stop:1964 length:465 start_codon:yes stop_codon:yes gene_type:complete